ncbi:MAG TPA: DinB family protein [Candidatus Solibacter sp.]|nr:DinB family protein [Candidatus Solibacter sp.]
MTTWQLRTGCALLMAAALALVAQQRQPPTPAQQIINNVNGVNRRILEMAKDFPEEKYNFRATPEVRSFGEVILHVMAGNTYGAKVARGVPDANWDKEEVDPKNYHGKAEIVAAFEKSANDAADALKALPPETFSKSLAPWPSVIEHGGEHYGQLVVYYRLNGMVPPASRPKK